MKAVTEACLQPKQKATNIILQNRVCYWSCSCGHFSIDIRKNVAKRDDDDLICAATVKSEHLGMFMFR